jgi:hypothetical protein
MGSVSVEAGTSSGEVLMLVVVSEMLARIGLVMKMEICGGF